MELPVYGEQAMITSKVQLTTILKTMLKTRIDKAIHGLMVLYEKQTQDEQANRRTCHNNGVGFTSHDSEFLTSLAQQYKAKGYLTPKQQEALMRIIPKYANQLIENSIAMGKIRKEKGQYVW